MTDDDLEEFGLAGEAPAPAPAPAPSVEEPSLLLGMHVGKNVIPQHDPDLDDSAQTVKWECLLVGRAIL